MLAKVVDKQGFKKGMFAPQPGMIIAFGYEKRTRIGRVTAKRVYFEPVDDSLLHQWAYIDDIVIPLAEAKKFGFKKGA